MSTPALLLTLAASLLPQGADADPLADRGLPVAGTADWVVLADGRMKPLETLAKETMRAITGRERLAGLDPLDFLWAVHLEWPAMQHAAVVKVNSPDLKAELGLGEERRYSYQGLLSNPRFRELVETGMKARDAEQALSPLQKDALEVYARLDRLFALASGAQLRMVPPAPGAPEFAWRTTASLNASERPADREVMRAMGEMAASWGARDAAAFGAAVESAGAALRAAHVTGYPEGGRLSAELAYNRLHAFGRGAWMYLLGFLVLVLSSFSPRRLWYGLGVGLVGLGFVGHTVGLGLRWYVAGRAPVSDMYESLVFMGWGAILFGLALEAVSRKRWFAVAAALSGFLALFFAEFLPIDSAISPLVPVLANTAWLSIHVMTIMLSYSAFAVAMTMGHVVLFLQFFRPGRTQQLRALGGLLYKAVQVGVLFLAAGIAFGAIWANESWGRYWGWDPKETWSLITFFVYLIVIHARFAGWIGNFGLAVSSIASFLAVVMTYYGVNFVLAAGLHSYGFSEGGMIWAASYGLFELAVIAVALIRYLTARRAPAPPEPPARA